MHIFIFSFNFSINKTSILMLELCSLFKTVDSINHYNSVIILCKQIYLFRTASACLHKSTLQQNNNFIYRNSCLSCFYNQEKILQQLTKNLLRLIGQIRKSKNFLSLPAILNVSWKTLTDKKVNGKFLKECKCLSKLKILINVEAIISNFWDNLRKSQYF